MAQRLWKGLGIVGGARGIGTDAVESESVYVCNSLFLSNCATGTWTCVLAHPCPYGPQKNVCCEGGGTGWPAGGHGVATLD